ncbi:hypothetical protein F383_25721 [Gossypium arboreum]|uniref:Uncharacterized protein n=1 Tax=Gossypium arboreum TaxID=29729 RepID=A0A0B0P5Z0_GOSAR|nr:hypothetical protein F383_25721 [Gossypium arboreum]
MCDYFRPCSGLPN